MSEPHSEAKKSATELGNEILASVKALENLIKMAIPETAARNEGKWQLYKTAKALAELAELSQKTPNDQAVKVWQLLGSQLLGNITPATEPHEDEPEEIVIDEEDVARRLGTYIPKHLKTESPSRDREVENSKRRIVVASVEPGDTAATLVNQAVSDLSKEVWSITNLGSNVPILALIGTVMEIKPGVLALIFNKGILLQETIRLITDLKQQLFGIKIIAVGSILAQATVTERINVDLYHTEVSKMAELAEQLFNPLNKLGSQLDLAVNLETAETVDPDAPTVQTPILVQHDQAEAISESKPTDEAPTVKKRIAEG